jgi:prepilin-type N-terminal cleavage/methylation domain-containing protein
MGIPPLQQKQQRLKAFTLIELMVTITIVVLVTGIVLVQYSSFNSSVLLTSQAYQLAFDLREAQSLAISVRGQGNSFREEYGLYFNYSTPGVYHLFQDSGTARPALYQQSEAIGTPNVIDPRFTIQDLCINGSFGQRCASSDAAATDLSVTFRRPDFDAAFGNNAGTNNITSAQIVIRPLNGSGSRVVTITTAGQISVQ